MSHHKKSHMTNIVSISIRQILTMTTEIDSKKYIITE